jgi:UPF0042 nucleotide-binding protein
MIVSFGYKAGPVPRADRVIDVRFLPNPYRRPQLATLDGRDEAVQQFVLGGIPDGHPLVVAICHILADLRVEHDRDWVIAIGCTGGTHRSVAVAEAVGRVMGEPVIHRELAQTEVTHA